tara:strand:- start:1964 stop:2377 length:414 start_codon:yes stop_codon:yes gene_type:complete
MSKLALTPNSSGSGTYTLASPNNNASHTLTLPVLTGTLLTTTGDGSGLTGVTPPTAFGAVGTYTWGRPANNTDYTEGDVVTSLITIGHANNDKNPNYGVGWSFAVVGTTMSGSWRAMARIGADAGGNAWVGLWVRIS